MHACSMIVAALAHRHVPQSEPIDLPTVCFAGGSSPDRQSALQGLEELRAMAPSRRWRLILVNSSLQARGPPQINVTRALAL